VQANKDCQQTLGQFLFAEGYPALHVLPLQSPEKSLVHAIIHRESMFNPAAMSPVGARGLMQLMPATASQMAKKAGERYNADRLISDPRYNTLLGSTYLHDLVDNYGGFYPMAIGAYNAGPGNVKSWIADFGDPRKDGVNKGGMNIIDWVEHIPIYETRNYIQRVMESYYIYRLRFGMEPKTILDFVNAK
jgi:soluble lytic murein transglycosylase